MNYELYIVIAIKRFAHFWWKFCESTVCLCMYNNIAMTHHIYRVFIFIHFWCGCLVYLYKSFFMTLVYTFTWLEVETFSTVIIVPIGNDSNLRNRGTQTDLSPCIFFVFFQLTR